MVLLGDYQAFTGRHYETGAMREGLAAQVMQIHDLEKTAVEVLQSALA